MRDSDPAAIREGVPQESFITHSPISKELQEMLLGNFNPYTEKLEIPKSYQVFSNFKKRVLNPAYKELKEKGDYYFEYELIKTGKKVISLNFQIPKKWGRGKN